MEQPPTREDRLRPAASTGGTLKGHRNHPEPFAELGGFPMLAMAENVVDPGRSPGLLST